MCLISLILHVLYMLSVLTPAVLEINIIYYLNMWIQHMMDQNNSNIVNDLKIIYT